ncbi:MULTISPECIES: hypothetical protein [Sinorhizobium]|jgi:hypothetical protein|uniref:Uncharacterized protein n=1 Tax=Rhizobium meliloti TaxID=382 RepID=A0A2J0YZJ6_RHIML|nr:MULTISPECIES: hypothetical protein [Sinorhizobium]PND21909.1 hypothetical protein CN934_07650 [Ensifer sp. MMN_5]GCA51762.1 hypothetical protein KGO5_04219 [Sinorhizobium sp. KGO-5]MCG5485616.1 hypothetical protein [Sinorhizobium meliloti]PJR13647.1 hypothetical protein CEJ86_20915 [Sinorhizobium meliloti]PND29411.1 hypothetical protein CN933_05075 [Sinorhizobium sp. M4_45]
MTENEQQYEFSEFSGEFVDDDIMVTIGIYRPAGTNADWTLEVVDQEGYSTVWDDLFATDRDAFQEFLATVHRDGIRSFLDQSIRTVH